MSAAAQRDYYEVLGVAKDAADKQIKDAFRKLAMQYHPDRNKEPGAEERFKEIAAAYAVLSDPTKRREYDERGFAAVGGVSPEDLFRNVDFADLFSGLGFDFGGVGPGGRGGLFERLFGRRRAGPMRGENIEVELEVPLERVATGGEETVKFSRPVVCTACGGSGAKRGTSPRRCEACQGTGRKLLESRRQPSRAEVRIDRWVSCPECGGRGMVIDQSCPECKGVGRVERQESLAVKIPVGVEEGMALRIPGHGMPSLEVGGSPGDLLVIVHSAADERFERVGTDLWRRERVTIPEAVLGTTLRVPSLEADVEVVVPCGTQPDSVLRLEGKGLPIFGASGRGDLNLRIEVSVPQRLTPKQRGLYEELRALESRSAATGATTRVRGRAKR